MNEVEKLYENAGIEPEKKCYYWDCPYSTGEVVLDLQKEKDCTNCKNPDKAFYPPFTAEKQIELIKWLMNYPMLDEISLFFNEPSKTFNLRVYSLPEIDDFRSTYTETQNNFEDMLCGLINNLWQDLTEAEKVQIKNILESEVRE